VNISANPLVRSGLKGKAASRMTQWQDSISLGASSPIYDQDRLVGVVLTGVLIDRSFVASLSRPGAEVAIFFANRLVVNSFKGLPEKALADLMRSRELVAHSATGAKQVQRLKLGIQDYTVTYLPLGEEEKPWENLILVGVNRGKLDRTLTILKLVIFGVGTAAALVGALLSVWLSTGMRRQIAALTEGTRRATKEELTGDIPVTSQDELGELAESFNTMTRALREKTRQLQEERDRIAANADFLSMIVHDIKAPLTGVRLTIETLEDETLPPEIHQKLTGIIQRSEGLLLHLQNVLDLSRFESGLLSLRPEAVPPAFLVQRLLQHFSPLAQNQGVEMTSAIPRDLPALEVDEPSLERVLANLLVNALEATPPGGAITVLGGLLTGENHPEVELVVADTGRGISLDEQEVLFEKYRQRPNQATSSGLGLYICQTLMTANRGRIWVESTPEQGARFHLVLPTAGDESTE
jgi:signal transduction histidine kinase